MKQREIYSHEEHGEVLETWRKLGYQNLQLLYFDRHLDLKCMSDEAVNKVKEHHRSNLSLEGLNRLYPFQDFEQYPYGLDNFLYAAIHLQMFCSIYWVYPEPVPLNDNDLAKIFWDQLSLIPKHGNELKSTFSRSSGRVSVKLLNVEIHMTTLSRLQKGWFDKSTVVDVDLDYFGTEDGRLLHSVEEVVEALKAFSLDDNLHTITYSITSGFLSPVLRSLGGHLSQLLHADLINQSVRSQVAEMSLKIIAKRLPISEKEFENLFDMELAPLGASGFSLASVLALRIPNISLAEKYYDLATLNGDNAYWPAYVLGLYHMEERNYAFALKWFKKAQGQRIDTLQNHAFCLQSLCEFRLNNIQQALETSLKCIECLPMRIDSYKILSAISEIVDIDQKKYKNIIDGIERVFNE